MSEQPDSAIEPTTESGGTDAPDADDATGLQHVTVDCDDGIAVCTMFPERLAEDEVAAKWLTASGESFVSLEDAR